MYIPTYFHTYVHVKETKGVFWTHLVILSQQANALSQDLQAHVKNIRYENVHFVKKMTPPTTTTNNSRVKDKKMGMPFFLLKKKPEWKCLDSQMVSKLF